MALPLLVAVTVGLVWLLRSAPPRCGSSTPPARPPARWPAATTDAAAVALGQRVAPDGAAFAVTEAGDEVHVVVGRRRADGPGGLFGFLPRGPARRPRRSRPARRSRREPAAGSGRARRGEPVRGGLPRGPAARRARRWAWSRRWSRPTASAQSAADLAALAAGRPRSPRAATRARQRGADRRRQRRRRSTRAGWPGCDVAVTVAVAGPRWLGQSGDLARRGAGGAGVSGVRQALVAAAVAVASESSRRSASTRSSFSESSLSCLLSRRRSHGALGAEAWMIEKPHSTATPAPTPIRKIVVPWRSRAEQLGGAVDAEQPGQDREHAGDDEEQTEDEHGRRLPGAQRRAARAGGRAAPGRPALSSGLFWLPHLGDWMHDGQPSVHSQARDRVAGRRQPGARPRGTRARRSRPRPGARRTRRR